jgi:hypothetical protein
MLKLRESYMTLLLRMSALAVLKGQGLRLEKDIPQVTPPKKAKMPSSQLRKFKFV